MFIQCGEAGIYVRNMAAKITRKKMILLFNELRVSKVGGKGSSCARLHDQMFPQDEN